MSEGTVAALCEAIWETEAELGLLRWEVRGVRPWEAGRVPAYQAITRALGLLQPAMTPLRPGLWPRARRAAVLAWKGARAQPFAAASPREVDALVFESARASQVDGTLACPATFGLTEQLTRQGQRLLLLDTSVPGQPDKTPDPRRRRLESIDLAHAIAGKAGPALFGAEVRGTCDAIEAALARRVGRSVSVRAVMAATLARFLVDRAAHRRLLAVHRPKAVYCVAPYAGLAPLIAAAREAGVRSVELQHGVITRYHLGYSFPGVDFGALAYFPDELFTWGEPWDALMDLPVPPERRRAHGFDYFERQAARYRGLPREPGRVLVISQGTIGRELSELVLRLSPRLSHCTIDYRLHPSEKARVAEYPALRALLALPNVRLQTEAPLYELMARCQWQLGVYSTALFEGRALGLRTALARLPGIENMARWFETGAAIDAEALPDALATGGARA